MTISKRRASMIEFLEQKIRKMEQEGAVHSGSEVGITNLHTIVKLLKEPVMPENPSDDLLSVMISASPDKTSEKYPYNKGKYNALRAALSAPPKPKMKTVWKFSYTWTSKNYVEEFNNERAAETMRESAVTSQRFTNISPIWSEEVEDK